MRSSCGSHKKRRFLESLPNTAKYGPNRGDEVTGLAGEEEEEADLVDQDHISHVSHISQNNDSTQKIRIQYYYIQMITIIYL